MRRVARWGWVLFVAGCTSAACQLEELPFRGRPVDPPQLFALAQYAARNDCTDTLYDLLSKRTRDQHGRLKFSLFWESLDVPDPWNYRVVDVVAKGQYVATLDDDRGRKLLYVQYEEPGKPELVAQLYIVQEQGVWRLALQEQVDENIEAAQPPAPGVDVALVRREADANGGCQLASPGTEDRSAPGALLAVVVALALARRRR